MKETNPDLMPTCFMWLTKRVKSDYRNRRGDLFLMNTRKKHFLGEDCMKESRKCFASYLISTFLMAEMKERQERRNVYETVESLSGF